MSVEKRVSLTVSDIALLTEIIRDAKETQERAERALSKIKARLVEAEDALAEFRTQFT